MLYNSLYNFTISHNKFAYFALALSVMAMIFALSPTMLSTSTINTIDSEQASMMEAIKIAKEFKANMNADSTYQDMTIEKKHGSTNTALHVALSLGLLSLFFAAFSYARSENKRLYNGALALAVLAIIWTFI
jgi:hypothetical protein